MRYTENHREDTENHRGEQNDFSVQLCVFSVVLCVICSCFVALGGIFFDDEGNSPQECHNGKSPNPDKNEE